MFSTAVVKTVPEPQQLELFGYPLPQLKAVSFFDIDLADQEQMVTRIARSGVTTVLDLRSRPVFERPRFHHKYLMGYLHARSIPYVELNLIVRSRDSDRWPTNCGSGISSAVRDGLNICVFDDQTVTSGRLNAFRRALRVHCEDWIELHPSAI